jgi:apolipoprotein N-acyltransferase
LGGLSLAFAWLYPSGIWCAALGWLSPFLLSFALLRDPNNRCKKPYRLCWIFGITAIALAFSWLARTISIFSGLPSSIALLVFCLFVFGSALQFPLTHWCAVRLPPWFHRWGIAYPLGWLAGEMVAPRIFPWHLGHTQLAIRPLALAASLSGAAPISFLMVWVATTLSIAIISRRYRPLFVSLVFLAGATLYGYQEMRNYQREQHPLLSVALIQANVSLEQKHDIAFFSANVESYQRLSQTVSPTTDLVIWPESVIQQFIPDSISTVRESRHLPSPLPTQDLLLGSLTFSPQKKPRNSALMLRPDGTIAPAYHKQILMPFGEYTPFADYLPWIAQINDRVANFSAGSGPAIISLTAQPAAILSPLICYEDTVPSLSRDAVRAGATILSSLSNDAWFGESAAPDQHELLAAFRAIETRRTLLRSTNTGTTGIIDPLGNSLGRLPSFSEGILEAAVPVVTTTNTPFTTFFEEWPARLIGWCVALWALIRRIREKTAR